MHSSMISCPAGRSRFYAVAVLALVATFALGLGIACAQDNQQPAQGPPPGGGGMGHRGMPSVDDQVKHLTKKLSLTDDQQTKVKPILEDQSKQMQQIFSDSSLSREDRFSKMQQVRQSSDTQIKALLTPDQQKKFDAMRAEQHNHMRGGMGGQKPDNADQPQQQQP